MSKQAEQADSLRGILRVTVGGEERQLRKLKLHPAEDWLERNAAQLAPLSKIEVGDLGDDIVRAVGIGRELFGALLNAIADYDADGVLGGADKLGDDIYPDELLPIFLQMRDAALPFVDLLQDHQLVPPVASSSPSSTSGRSRTGASTQTPSVSVSTPAS
jgi:hypothetical protein